MLIKSKRYPIARIPGSLPHPPPYTYRVRNVPEPGIDCACLVMRHKDCASTCHKYNEGKGYLRPSILPVDDGPRLVGSSASCPLVQWPGGPGSLRRWRREAHMVVLCRGAPSSRGLSTTMCSSLAVCAAHIHRAARGLARNRNSSSSIYVRSIYACARA